jgi:ABC-2 type transport system ATP-binding protein
VTASPSSRRAAWYVRWLWPSRGRHLDVELKLGPTSPEILDSLAQFGHGLAAQNGCVRLRVTNEEMLPEIARSLVSQGVKVYRLGASRKTLETVFLEVMGDDERPG